MPRVVCAGHRGREREQRGLQTNCEVSFGENFFFQSEWMTKQNDLLVLANSKLASYLVPLLPLGGAVASLF